MTDRSPRPTTGLRRRLGAALAVLGLVGTTVLIATPSAQAAPVLTPLVTDSFATATTTSPNWKTVTAAGSATPCLTAGSNPSTTPIGGCGTPSDPSGAGTLRLTNNFNSQGGTVYNTISIPTSAGIDVAFDTYQYNGSGADGIAFILAAADPDNPSAPSINGPIGGSLGYSGPGGGVSYGYLGFGLDVYGNFSSPGASGAGCATTTFAPRTVVVRGPGNGSTGYCLLSSRSSTGLLDARGQTSRPASVPVRIALNPTTSPATTASGLTVPASSWLIAWTSYGAAQQTMTGPLPTAARLSALGFPAGYFNPTTGLPYQLTFGWSAATGGATEFHEINQLSSTTLTGQLPAWRLSVGDDQGGRFLTGSTGVVTVTPSLDPAQGDETEDATVTTTFPAGLTPALPTGTDYVCTVSGQVVSCRYAVTTTIPAGSALPTLQIPVSVSAAAGSTPVISSKVSSLDGNPRTATRTVTVAAFTATATPSSVPFSDVPTLSASGLAADATGTITFSSGGTVLCVATLPGTGCTPTTTPTVGTYPVTAAYSGDATHPAVTATTSFTVTQASPSVSAAANSASVPYGTSQTLIGVVSPPGATGSIRFVSSGGTELCTIADITLARSCAVPADLEPGTWTVTAVYSGDANVAAGNSPTFTFDVVPAAVNLTAGVAAATTVYGTANVLSFSGLPAGATGSVVFTSGDVVLCTVADITTAAGCSAPADLDTGDYPVVADYSGDARYQAASAETAFSVTSYPTDLAAGVSDESVPFGTSTTLSWSGIPAGATGTVTFTTGDTVLCTVDVTAAAGCATPTTLPAGSYTVTAAYSGDANHDADTAGTAFTVTPADVPTFAAGVSDDAPVYGTAVTLSFSGLPTGATGTVVFRAGDAVLCEIADVTVAAACVAPADLDAGSYDVTATYSGDPNYAPATAATGFTVAPAPTAVTAATSATTTPYGTPVVLSFAGLPAGATGTVTWSGAAGLCVIDVGAEIGTCPTPADLPVGSYTLTATYSGDADHLGSSAEVEVEVVPVTSPDFTAAAGPVETPFGAPPTLSWTGLVPGATGSVTFTAGGDTLCVIDDVTTTTSCVPQIVLPVGEYAVTAAYSGDANRAPATAGTAFTVNRADVSPTVSLGRPAVEYGTATTATVAGLPAGATGSVDFYAGPVLLCTVADITVATACSLPADLPAGSYDVVAVYAGDGSYNPATSPAVTLTVDKAPSAVTVVVSDAAPVFGAGTTLSLGNLPVGATGSATFTSGGVVLCTITNVASEPGCAVPADLPAGRYVVDGVWSGDANHLGSSAAGAFDVLPAPTAVTLSVPDLVYGADAVPVIGGLPAGVTGTVTLTTADGTVLCVRDVAAGTGCEALPGLGAGTYTVTAVYSGDRDHLGSQAVDTFTVAQRSIAFDVTVADTTYGTPAVAVVTGLPAGTTGTLTFSADGTVVCTLDVATGTGCEAAFAALPPGDYAWDVAYSGDANNQPATTTVAFTVAKAPTAVTVTVPDVAVGGAVVPAVGGLPADATGTVTFTSGGELVCVLDLATGTGCEGLVADAAGEIALDAAYSGDTNYLPSTATTTFTISRAVVPVVGTPSGPVVTGGTITLTVGDQLPADATGTVSFVAPDGTVLCTVTLPDRTCTVTTTLPPGTYDIRVLYSGDEVYAPSESVTTLTVTAAPATTTTTTTTTPTGSAAPTSSYQPPLAYTGASIGGWAVAAALLLAAGGLLLLGSRRRAGTRRH